MPAISSPFSKNRKLITPTYKKPEEERLAAEKAKEEKKAVQKAEEERVAVQKAKEFFFKWKKAAEEKKATEEVATAEKAEETELFVDDLYAEMEEIVEVPVPMTQEEIVPEPNIIQHEPRLGIVSPMTPDTHSFFLNEWKVVCLSTTWQEL